MNNFDLTDIFACVGALCVSKFKRNNNISIQISTDPNVGFPL